MQWTHTKVLPVSPLETSRPDHVGVIVRRLYQSSAPLEEKELAQHQCYQDQEDEDGRNGGDPYDNTHCLLGIQTIGRSRFCEERSSSTLHTQSTDKDLVAT